MKLYQQWFDRNMDKSTNLIQQLLHVWENFAQRSTIRAVWVWVEKRPLTCIRNSTFTTCSFANHQNQLKYAQNLWREYIYTVQCRKTIILFNFDFLYLYCIIILFNCIYNLVYFTVQLHQVCLLKTVHQCILFCFCQRCCFSINTLLSF